MGKNKKSKKSKKETAKKGSTATLVVLAEKTLNFARLESGEWYTGVFEEHAVGDGRYGAWIRMNFKIKDGQTEEGESAKGEIVSGFTDYEVAPGRMLYDAVCAFQGIKTLEEDEEIDIEAYYGSKVRVFVEDRKAKKGEKYDGRQSVVKIKPLKAKKKKKGKK